MEPKQVHPYYVALGREVLPTSNLKKELTATHPAQAPSVCLPQDLAICLGRSQARPRLLSSRLSWFVDPMPL